MLLDALGLEGVQTQQLLRAGAGSIALKAFEAGLGLVSSIVMARVLGADEYGTYAFGAAVAGLLAIVGGIGLPELVVRDVATYRVKADWPRLRGIVRWSSGVVLVLSALLALGTAGVMAVLGGGPLTGRTALPLVIVAAPLMTLAVLHGSTLRGLGKVLLGQVPLSLLRPVVILAWVIAGSVILEERFDADWAVAGLLVATAAVFVFTIILLRREFPSAMGRARSAYNPRSWTVAALPMALVGGMHVINQRADMVMVGSITGAGEAGIYRVASQGAMLIAFVFTAVNMVIQPMVASHVAKGNRERLQVLATGSSRLVLALSAPIALIFIGFGGPILELVFGTQFRAGWVPLAILSGGQILNVAVGSMGVLLTMGGWERQTAWGIGIGTVANVAMNALLVPYWGATGAAIATAGSLVLSNVILAFSVHRKIGIRPTALGRFPTRE